MPVFLVALNGTKNKNNKKSTIVERIKTKYVYIVSERKNKGRDASGDDAIHYRHIY